MAEGDFPKSDGDVLFASEVNDIQNDSLGLGIKNKVRQDIDRAVVISESQDVPMIFSEAYISSSGRYSTQESFRTAEFNSTDLTFETYDFDNDPYVIIEATDVPYTTSFTENNCKMAEMDTGKWLVICDDSTASAELKRARIYDALYGAKGAILSADNVTAVRTSVSRDVGKNFFWWDGYWIGSHGSPDVTVTGTFANTTDNDDASAWSWCIQNNIDHAGSSDVRGDTEFSFPTGTLVNIASSSADSNAESNELATDTSADETDNPSTTTIFFENRYPGSGSAGPWRYGARILILCKGGLTWNVTASISERDYNTDYSIPNLSAVPGGTTLSSMITNWIRTGTREKYPSAPNKITGSALTKKWESGVNIEHRLSTKDLGVDFTDNTEVSMINVTSSYGTYPTGLRLASLYNIYLMGATIGSVRGDIKLSNTSYSSAAYMRARYFYEDGTDSGNIDSSAVASTSYSTVTINNPSASKPVKYIAISWGRNISTYINNANSSYIIRAYIKDVNTNSSITNYGSTSSPWVTDGETKTFTALGLAPIRYDIRLTPKTSSPTANYPSVYGTGVLIE